MKTFRFSLQAVLVLRERAEQVAQQRCAQAVAAVLDADRRLKSAQTTLAQAQQLCRARLAAGVSADEFEQLRRYTVVLEERRARRQQELSQLRQRAELARQQLLVATQRREALERLRDRQRRGHEYQVARAEQKMLDELAHRGAVLADMWRGPVPGL